MDDLEQLGIMPAEVEKYLLSLRSIFVHSLKNQPMNGLILDLNYLPTAPVNFKDAVIKWLISVNLDRLRTGDEPILTLDLVLRCPVWKLVNPPLRKINMKQESLLNGPKPPKIIGKSRSPGSINK